MFSRRIVASIARTPAASAAIRVARRAGAQSRAPAALRRRNSRSPPSPEAERRVRPSQDPTIPAPGTDHASAVDGRSAGDPAQRRDVMSGHPLRREGTPVRRGSADLDDSVEERGHSVCVGSASRADCERHSAIEHGRRPLSRLVILLGPPWSKRFGRTSCGRVIAVGQQFRPIR